MRKIMLQGSLGALMLAGCVGAGDGDVGSAPAGEATAEAASALSCGSLPVNTPLGRGQTVSSCNGQYQLSHQTDGNVVFYRNSDGYPLWSSATGGRATTSFIMQGDGNLVLYNNNTPVWSTGTYAPGATLSVKDDGHVTMYDTSGRRLWTTGSYTPTACGGLWPGDVMQIGDAVYSCNGGYRFLFADAGDGSFVSDPSTEWTVYQSAGHGQADFQAPPYDGSRFLWGDCNGLTAAGYVYPNQIIMQNDGNLVFYTSSGSAAWASNTGGHPGAYFAIQDDGNLVIYHRGSAIWASATSGGVRRYYDCNNHL